MWGWIIGLGAAGAFVGITAKEVLTPTGKKLKSGDAAFVETTKLTAFNNSPTDDVINGPALAKFLEGFTTSTVKVTSIELISGTDFARGKMLGLPAPDVKFPLAAVKKIERDGKLFT